MSKSFNNNPAVNSPFLGGLLVSLCLFSTPVLGSLSAQAETPVIVGKKTQVVKVVPPQQQAPSSTQKNMPQAPAVVFLSAEKEPIPQTTTPERPQAQEVKTIPSIQAMQATQAPSENGQLRLSAEDPLTGKTVNIDINSENLHYDAKTGLYEALGEVYMIIPEEDTEILADKLVYNTKNNTMVTMGNVFIIHQGDIIGSTRAAFDLDKNYSFYENPKTITEYFKLVGEQGQRFDKLTVVKNGHMLIDQASMKKMASHFNKGRYGVGTGFYSFYSANWARQYQINSGSTLISDLSKYFTTDDIPDQAVGQDTVVSSQKKIVSPRDIETADFGEDNKAKLRFKIKEANIYRGKKGFDIVEFKNTTYKVGKVPVFYSPVIDFGYIEDKSYLSYLGPELGYDIDMGGYYAGPGFQKQFAKGWLKFVPFLTYGQGRRTSASANDPDIVQAQPGVGAELAYLSPSTRLRGGYNTTLGDGRFIGEHRLFGQSNTRLRFAYNHVVSNGLYGAERPHWIAEARDIRRNYLWDKRLALDSYISAGAAEDELFPTGHRRFYVRARSIEPITTFRGQLQLNLQTARPIIQIKDFLAIGATSRLRASYYGTSDHLVVAQGGPYALMTLGPFYTSATYLAGLTSGSSPFVFDSYYGGNNFVQLVNSVDITKHLTVGIQHGFNLSRDNARRDLIVDQQVFVSTGPDAMKFSFGYDLVLKRSYFGVTFNPQGGNVGVKFDRLNYYDPGYESQDTRRMQETITPDPTGSY